MEEEPVVRQANRNLEHLHGMALSDKTHFSQLCCTSGCIAQHAAGTKVL